MDIIKALKYACVEREISAKICVSIFRDYFLCGRIDFENTITAFRVVVS